MANDTDNVTGTAAEDAGLDAPKNAMATAGRLFGQLRNQRVRLAVVAASIILYTFFHIGAPMYSAVVVDAIWNAVQDAWQSGAPFAIGWGGGGAGGGGPLW